MQHSRHQSRRARKSRRACDRAVGGHFTFGNASDGSFDSHSHLRRLIGRLIGSMPSLRTLRLLPSLLHSAIHPTRISHSEPTRTSTHRIIPCSSGRCPTRLIVATEMPLPIKNKVAVKPIFATFTAIA